MLARAGSTCVILTSLALTAQAAENCGIGALLRPGESCALTLQWDADHWITADFPADGRSHVSFSHLAGACRVALFGPPGSEDAQLAPGQAPTRRSLPGEYHFYIRSLVLDRGDCRYRIAVD